MKKLLLVLTMATTLGAVAQCPEVNCPANIIVGADSNQCSAMVNYIVNGSDTCGGTFTSTFGFTGQIDTFTVPVGITMVTIQASGAQGGNSLGVVGGLGATMIGDFIVTPGQQLKILVGNQGIAGVNTTDQSGGSGGGGAFVTDISNNPLIVAGGGGGAMAYVFGNPPGAVNGGPGQTTTSGQAGDGGGSAGGTGGNGGITFPWTGWHSGTGGGGLLTDGVGTTNGNTGSYGTPNSPGLSFLNGGAGGIGGSSGRNGAFGGGGSAGYTGAGGGGYSGGGSGSHQLARTYSGGGGGSFNNGTNQTNTGGANSGNGQVVISYNNVTVTQLAGLPSGSAFPVGTTTNTYMAAGASGPNDTCSFTVTVVDSGQATILGALSQDTICTSAGALTLPAGTPAGGTYTGTGVTGNSFDPAVAQQGNHWVYYTDTVGCQNSDSALVTVVWCTGIESSSLKHLVKISPNPSNGQYTLTIPAGENFSKVEVFDALGRNVMRAANPSTTQVVNIEDQPNGLYYLQLELNGITETFRLIKR